MLSQLYEIFASSLVEILTAILFPTVIVVDTYLNVKVGAFSSNGTILSTFANAVPLFPALSWNSKVNSPFSVNVYVFFVLLFVIVTSSSLKLIVAVTDLFSFVS